ncbi:MAG: signal peptidase I [Acidimicrobiales bacterium]
MLWLHVWLAAVAIALPLLAGGRAVVVAGDSMEPVLHRGDVVVAADVTRSTPPSVGQVLTFRTEGQLVTHRVVSIDTDGVARTQGDANRDADSTPVRPRMMVGLARLVVPAIARPREWVTEQRWGVLAAWIVLIAASPVALDDRRLERLIARLVRLVERSLRAFPTWSAGTSPHR